MTRLAVVAAALLAVAPVLAAQSPEAPRADAGGVHLTVFRSPATGLEWRAGRLSVFGGFYPTIIKADGQAEGENTNFIRVGGAAYLRPRGITPYLAPSIVFSLDEDWSNGLLTEAGVRAPIGTRVAFRLGVGVLSTFDGEVRVNPTVGLDLRLGGRR